MKIVNNDSCWVNWNTAYTDTNAATDAATNSTIVKRGATGNIAVSKLTADNGVILGTMPSAATGGIQWTGTDFHGYNGSAWVSLTSAATAQLSGAVATFTATQTTQSTTYVDVPGYTASVTVTNNSNIVNVQVTTEVSSIPSNSYIKLVRVVGGTPTDLYEQQIQPDASSGAVDSHFAVSYADQHGQSNSTVITYKLMFKTTGSSNNVYVNPDPQSTAQIFLSEITTSPITVSSVNGASGAVVLDTDDIAEGSSNLYFPNDYGSVV